MSHASGPGMVAIIFCTEFLALRTVSPPLGHSELCPKTKMWPKSVMEP